MRSPLVFLFAAIQDSVWLTVEEGSANVGVNLAEGGRHGVVEEAKSDRDTSS